MADGLLEAVRGLWLADPELGPKPLLAKLRKQQPGLEAGNKEVREALTTLKAETDVIFELQLRSSEKDDGGLAKKLLDRGVDPFGGSWFPTAIASTAERVVCVLLEGSANPNERFWVTDGVGVKRRSTPLDLALFAAAPSMVNLLLRAGSGQG